MYKQFTKCFLAATLLMSSSLNSAYALTSTGADGAFLLNNAFTLNATNQQTFNFTTFDLQQDGVLDFSGLMSGDDIFVLATGDIHLNGILNLSSNLTFETSGAIYIAGTINAGSNTFSLWSTNTVDIANGSNINTSGNDGSGLCLSISGFNCDKTPIAGSILAGGLDLGSGRTQGGGLDLGRGRTQGGGLELGRGRTQAGGLDLGSGRTNPSSGGSILVTAQVPEPSTYAFFLAGLSLMMLRRNKNLYR